jgi:hypothetical protein
LKKSLNKTAENNFFGAVVGMRIGMGKLNSRERKKLFQKHFVPPKFYMT